MSNAIKPDQSDTYQKFLPPPLRDIAWRPHPLDGKLLLFDRDSGLNILLDGEETTHLRRVAPRSLLIAVTNICNMTCSFCYRDLTSPSGWITDTLLEFCQQADQWGVAEVAFGGGEPTLFPNWADFICELYNTTGLGINFTTNGLMLTPDFLRQIAGKIGQMRLSLYEDNHPDQTIRLLVDQGARFGVNWLVTPTMIETMESRFTELISLGVRDFLFLSYKGSDPMMHLAPDALRRFTDFIVKAHNRLGATVSIKLDVCWGDSIDDVPRLFDRDDCEAGAGFLSITSDRRIKPCSFHHQTIPFESLADVRAWWQSHHKNQRAAQIVGCARLPMRGLSIQGGIT